MIEMSSSSRSMVCFFALQFGFFLFIIFFMVLQEGWPILMFCGALGAMAKDVLQDNKLCIPKYEKGFLYLGCLGGILIGACAGYFVDNDPVTAFLGGYAGTQIIHSLINGKVKAV